MPHSVFVTGSTGYMGQRLIPVLMKRGHQVKAFVRKGSESKLSSGAVGVIGDALKRIPTVTMCAALTLSSI